MKGWAALVAPHSGLAQQALARKEVDRSRPQVTKLVP